MNNHYDLNEKFWDVILGGLTEHDLFMFTFLAEKRGFLKKPSVKIFDWECSEYNFDFPDPPEVSL